jgi:hypothetical protein
VQPFLFAQKKMRQTLALFKELLYLCKHTSITNLKQQINETTKNAISGSTIATAQRIGGRNDACR